MLGTYQPGGLIFCSHTFLPFHTVHGVLKARILKWFAIPFSSGPCLVKHLTKDGETLYSQQKQDQSSDHELLIAKFRLKLKKVGQTTRPFRMWPHRRQPPRLCCPWDSPGQEHWSGLPFPPPMHESEKWKWSRSVVSDSSWPHGLQPTRLLCPWDFPGKSTGVGCHCLPRITDYSPKFTNSLGC